MFTPTRTIIIGEFYELPHRPSDPEDRVDYDVVLNDGLLAARAIDKLREADILTDQRESLVGHFTLTIMSPEAWIAIGAIPDLSLRLHESEY